MCFKSAMFEAAKAADQTWGVLKKVHKRSVPTNCAFPNDTVLYVLQIYNVWSRKSGWPDPKCLRKRYRNDKIQLNAPSRTMQYCMCFKFAMFGAAKSADQTCSVLKKVQKRYDTTNCALPNDTVQNVLQICIVWGRKIGRPDLKCLKKGTETMRYN